MDMSDELIDFEAQIPFLGFEGFFFTYLTPKVYFFLLHVKFTIDGYITLPY
jgi:hypothetical protein